MSFEEYTEREMIGGGGMSTTYQATHRSGEVHCLKEFLFNKATGWKLFELFEREAGILARLDHPQVPDFKGYFQVEEDGRMRYFIAQEYISGRNLEEEVKRNGPLTEQETIEVANEVLDVLEYLHDFNPQVIHRDVKPSNFIRREDGSIALVDFGSVRTEAAKTVGGSTIVGTFGYAPPEMFYGHAEPKTDYYSLAASMIYLLTGREPNEFMNGEHRLEVKKKAVRGSKKLRRLLHEMTEPDLEKRLGDVKKIRKRLGGLSREIVCVDENTDLKTWKPPKYGLKAVLAWTALVLVAFNVILYFLPSYLPIGLIEEKEKKTTAEDVGIGLGLISTAGLGILQGVLYYSFPPLLAIPAATNLASGIYEIKKWSDRRKNL